MKSINNLPVVFLTCVGRTGSGFLHSLLDSHPEILVIPFEIKFHKTWDVLGCDKIANANDMTRVWCEESRLSYLGKDMSSSEGEGVYTKSDPKIFKERLYELLKESGCSRKNVFFAVNQAYAYSMHQNIDDVKVIVNFSGHYPWMDKELGDFPNARFLEAIRDPRGNYASLKQHYLNTRKGLIDFRAKKLMQVSALIFIIHRILLGAEKFSAFRRYFGEERFFSIRLEDLHMSLEPTINKVASWLGVKFHPCLLESTRAGIPWRGNSAFGKPVLGVNPKVVTRWKEKLSKSEIIFIEYIFKKYMLANNYEFTLIKEKTSCMAAFIQSLIPVRGEFPFFISKRIPGNRYLKKLWKIHSAIVFALRIIIELVRMLARILIYPIVRFYLAGLIFGIIRYDKCVKKTSFCR